MNKHGFTLIELLIVMFLMGTLIGIGSYSFSQQSRKSSVVGQTKELYAALLEYQARSLYEKKNWTFKFSSTGYGIYSSANVTVAPVSTVAFKTAIESNTSTNVTFNSQGVANVTGKTVCATAANDATVDSVIISPTRVQIGKKQRGETCEASKIVAQ